MEYIEAPWGQIPANWQLSKIKDETTIVTDYVANGSFASLAEHVQYKKDEDYAVLIRLADYTNNFNKDFVFIDENAYNFLSKSKLYGGEIIISNVGAVGVVFRCPYLKYKMSLAPNSIMVKFKGDNDFYFYWLKSRFGQHMLHSIVTGSAQPKFNKTNFKDMVVPVPPIEVQRRIGELLKSFDDKIENNIRINRNLEEQAQALFKSWFVDFEPWGGSMPEDWKEGTLGDIVTVKRGGSPRPIQEYLSDKGFRWLKISDATAEASPFISHIVEHIKEEGLNKTVFIKQGSLVLSNSATPGLPKFVDLDTCIHDGWLYFPQSYFPNEYLYLLFQRERSYLLSQGNGSVFTNLKTDIVKNLSVTIPAEDVLNSFQKIIGKVFMEILNNQRESARLATIRDTLLPKLMRGEITL